MIDLETGNSRFGEVLAQALHLKRLSQTQLAHNAAISQSTVSKLISGKRALTADVADRLSDCLGGQAEAWLRAQSEILDGSEKTVEEHVTAITGIRYPKSGVVERVGTRVTQLREDDIIRVFNTENDGYITRGNLREPCQIDPFSAHRVSMTSYDTHAGSIGTPPKEGGVWTGEPVTSPIVIPPHDFRYVGTAEYIHLPSWLEAELHPASNIALKPLIVSHGPVIDPKFKGRLYVTVYNPTSEPKEISLTEAFLTLRFWLAED